MNRLLSCFMRTLVFPLKLLRARSFYHHRQYLPELGYHIKAFINLEVNPGQKKDFYPYIKSCNNVIECNCVTGDYAMLVEVMFKSTEELDHFIGELQTFGSTKTQIVFSTSVEHRGIPLSTEEE